MHRESGYFYPEGDFLNNVLDEENSEKKLDYISDLDLLYKINNMFEISNELAISFDDKTHKTCKSFVELRNFCKSQQWLKMKDFFLKKLPFFELFTSFI